MLRFLVTGDIGSEVMLGQEDIILFGHHTFITLSCFFQVVEQISCAALQQRDKSHALFAYDLFLPHITFPKCFQTTDDYLF